MTTTSETITLADYITSAGITMTYRSRGTGTSAGWPQLHNRYSVVLRRDGHEMRVAWHQGVAVSGPPTAAAVLSCLLDDAATVLNTDDFEDWCDELGYDSDSRTAERTWQAIGKQVAGLETLLGGRHALKHALYEVARD